jgi:16S rRNA (guanine527-N7)-methyltransferase
VNDEFRRFLARAERVGVRLNAREVDQVAAYYRLLTKWNRAINLTGAKLSPMDDTSLDRLLIEPLKAAQLIVHQPIDWFDVGSGGGSPAIPMKIVRPSSILTMVEARSRKAAFLRAAVRELQLMDVQVIQERFENVKEGAADLITVRAVRIDACLLDTAARLCRHMGRMLVFTSETVLHDHPNFNLERAVELLPGGRSHVLAFECIKR